MNILSGEKNLFKFAAQMVDVAQSVRALDCGSRGRGFEPHLPPEVLPGFLQRIPGILFLDSSRK